MIYKKLAYLMLGWISLLLGVIGVVLPLLPTTPFVLLAAFCFSRSSEKFHKWLLNHRIFGPLIRDWHHHGVIKLKAKILSTVSMALMVSVSFYFLQIPKLAMFTIILTMLAVLTFVWTRPSIPYVLKEESNN